MMITRTEAEEKWVQQRPFLEANGYQLRPRYQDNWSPSWVAPDGTEDIFAGMRAEDGIMLSRGDLLDAKRVKDDTVVMLKRVSNMSFESAIGRYFTSRTYYPENHCMPILDVLDDPTDEENSIIVLPLLRPIHLPPPATFAECVDFIEQTLEGLEFMHRHHVAHRDCTVPNIMMDARRMFPDGWHPMMPFRLLSGDRLPDYTPTRTEVGGVRYYFIDFGISTKGYDEIANRSGTERPPEWDLPEGTPFNPYKVDVYILGMTYRRFILDHHRGAEAVLPLVDRMTTKDPKERPTAAECMQIFKAMKDQWSPWALGSYLRPYDPSQEGMLETFIRDVVNYASSFWREPIRAPKHVEPLPPFK